jgi:glycine/D-amino acid oxidase-like deaminating enzyme
MGLCTAYAASHFTNNITILEKSNIGNKTTASFGYTRSIRNDYLDPLYARLAYEARRLWQALEDKAAEPLIIECGCLNIAKGSITPDLATTYAEQSYRALTSLQLKTEAFTRASLRQRYPQFDVDMARLDVEAGFLYLPAVTRTLLDVLQERQAQIVEHVEVTAIAQQADTLLRVVTSRGEFLSPYTRPAQSM